MSDYPRCRTCKHYRDNATLEPYARHDGSKGGYTGFCAATQGPYDEKQKATWGRMAITVDGSSYASELLVTPDFGCMLHSDITPIIVEPKESGA